MSEFEIHRVERLLAGLVERKRPPPHLRPQLDLAWRREGHRFEVFEVRARWQGAPGETIENPVARTTWVKSRRLWRLYWMRADGKWHRYDPLPEARTLEAVLEEIEADRFGCFWG
ncbi:DUF3024 domain-containing protein [Luteimonas sp. TWI1416]|uniref:DUF3024 domain-containing protein n=1 Tax=unclassified Luteimonas TaxID=2629088 RepID=UPI00320B23BB